ncbi:hypothetical protein [Pedobacter panaciterrae]
MRKLLFFSLCVICFAACRNNEKSPELSNKDIAKVLDEMTSLMIHDVTNPPLAARFFTYASLSGYEVVVQNDSNCISMKGILNDYPEIIKPSVPGSYSYQLSAILAMIATAKKCSHPEVCLKNMSNHF